MLQDAIMQNKNLLISPEKTFELPLYAKQMARAFADSGCSKTQRRKDAYAVAILQFIDGSASEGRESSESSGDLDSVIFTHEIDNSLEVTVLCVHFYYDWICVFYGYIVVVFHFPSHLLIALLL